MPLDYRFVAILTAITAVGPFAMQIFLPALPAIQSYFGSDPGTAQLTISLSMLATGVATVFLGPLSDRFGRYPVLLAGQCLFLAGSIVCALAESIGVLIAARIVQAIGSSSGMVLSRAMARDTYGPEQSIRVMSTVIMVMVVAPMLAPAVGGLLVDFFGWRTIFYVLAGTAALLLLTTVFVVRETIRSKLTGGWRELASGTRALLKSRLFIGYVLISSFSMSLFFIFVTASPYLMAQTLGRSAQEYGFWFITVSAAFMLGTFTSTRLLGRWGPDRLMAMGAFCAGVLVLGAAGLFLLLPLSPLLLFGPAYLIAYFQGWISVNAQGSAVNIAPRFAGTASGVMGFSQMVVAAGFSQAVGMFADGTAIPMIGLMAVCCIGGISALGLVRPAPVERAA